jgi:uncharacterized protein YecE (DUF72 family)
MLNCAEINSSFYRPHRQATWERWRESVPDYFYFSVKAPRAITHEAELRCEPQILEDFLQQANILGKKLGPVLFQLPPSLQFKRRPVKKFLKMLRERFAGSVVWEPRHASWFSDDADDLLASFDIARVAADPAVVPEAALPGGCDGLVYFRLHGSPRRYYSSYDDRFLSEFAVRLKGLRGQAEVWCVFDNTASGAAVRNALDLSGKMKNHRCP